MAQSVNISGIQPFNLLKIKFGEKEAEQFISLIKEEIESTFDKKKDSLSAKTDLANLELKIAQLETTIAKTESKLLLWAFVFLATQLGAIFAFLKFFIKQ